MIDLVKRIPLDSLRGAGSVFTGLGPAQLPIAARTRQALLLTPGCEAFRIEGIQVDDVVVLREGTYGYYVFVRPDYTAYRKIARLRFGDLPSGYDVDHLHARKLAGHLGYRYVLLAVIPLKINRLHGQYER